MKMSVWAPALDLSLDQLPTDSNELAAAWFTCSFCEYCKLIPCKLSSSEFELWMLLLEEGDPGVFLHGSFMWSPKIVKGCKIRFVAPSVDWPFNQVSDKLTSLVVGISEEYLTRSYQFDVSVPYFIYGTVDKSLCNNTWYWGLNLPMVGLHIHYTLLAWKGECPIYTPILEHCSHFSVPEPPALWRRASST